MDTDRTHTDTWADDGRDGGASLVRLTYDLSRRSSSLVVIGALDGAGRLSRSQFGAHSFQVRSMAAVAKYLPSSLTSAHMMRPSWPSSVRRHE
jgi:hypothetical protein